MWRTEVARSAIGYLAKGPKDASILQGSNSPFLTTRILLDTIKSLRARSRVVFCCLLQFTKGINDCHMDVVNG